MFYFKTIPFPEDLTHSQVEKALRKYSLKRTSSLDFKSCTYNIGMEQLFLGRDRKIDLQFTRLKTSLEILLPKMIIKLSKDPETTVYKIRLSTTPMGFAIVLAFGIVAVLITIFKGTASVDSIAGIGLPMLIFIGLIFFELRLVTGRINKAIVLYLKNVANTTDTNKP